MGGFALGMHDLSRAFGFLRSHPPLWRWVLAPALVTLLLLVALIAGVIHFATRIVGSVEAHLPTWVASTVGSLMMLLVVVALAAGALFVLATFAGIVAGPFCEQLSEAVEEIHTGIRAPRDGAVRVVHELVRGAGHSFRRLAGALAGAIALLALSFVPVAGHVVALVLGGYLASRASAYDCYDSLLARRRLAYDTKLAILRARRGRSLGLGAAVAALLLVPVVNLLAFGLGTIGATLALLDDPPVEARRTLAA